MNEKNHCTVLFLPEKKRWFCGFNKKGHVKSAWSLAGANTYLNHADDWLKDRNKIIEKGKRVEVMLLQLSGMSFAVYMDATMEDLL